MATPTLDLLCCAFQYNSTQSEVISNTTMITSRINDNNFAHRIRVYGNVFHSTLIVSSVLSIFGAIVMLYPKSGDLNAMLGQNQRVLMFRRAQVVDQRQKRILSWLSFADIMACIGLIMVASDSLYVLGSTKLLKEAFTGQAWEWVCIISTVWIHFFFLSSYIWTLCYAVDVYLFLKKTSVRGLFKIYFFVSWLLPAVFIVGGLAALYETSPNALECSAQEDHGLLLTFYLCIFIPLVIVLILMPIMYFMAGREVSPLVRSRGVYTNRERQVERQVREKFLKIVIVFVICWLPNVINGILLISDVDSKEYYVVLSILWTMMAILNPLQAFLNTLVYWGPAGCTSISAPSTDGESDASVSDYLRSHPPLRNAAVPSDTESSPLLQGRGRLRTEEPLN